MGEDILTAPPVRGLADAIGRRWYPSEPPDFARPLAD